MVDSRGIQRQSFYQSLSFQMLVGLVAGGAIGFFWPDIGVQLNPLATGFVKLIKMIAGVVVFLTIVTGIANMGRDIGIGRIGVTSIIYFEIVSTLALLFGLFLGNYFEPGAGLSIPADGAQIVSKIAEGGKAASSVDFLLNIIPKTVVDALSGGVMLQILLVSLLFGYALYSLGEKGEPLVRDLSIMTDMTFKVVGMILKLAPIGIFGAAAFTLGKFGIASLLPLMKLIGIVYLGCFVFSLVVFGLVARLTKFSLLKFILHIREEIIIAFTTTSSEAALPGLLRKLEKAGCDKAVTGFVVPAGYSFNLDGSSIYMTLAALFIAQAAGLHLGAAEQIALFFVFLLTSKGMAGISGGAFVTLAASLLMFPDIPLSGLALILGIDRIMDSARTVTNVIGNGVAAMAIAYWHGQRDDSALAAATLEPAAPAASRAA